MEFDGMLKAIQTDMNVRKRDGRLTSFNSELILIALQKAFCADQGVESAEQLDPKLRDV